MRTEKPLEALLITISNYDNKASSLLTAVGIIFGFSMFSIDEISKKCSSIRIVIMIFGILYLAAFLLSIMALTLIVFPRRKPTIKRKDGLLDFNCYSEDLYKRSLRDNFNVFITTEPNEETIIDQIKECSRIAHIKECLLRISTISIIAMSLFLTVIILLLFL